MHVRARSLTTSALASDKGAFLENLTRAHGRPEPSLKPRARGAKEGSRCKTDAAPATVKGDEIDTRPLRNLRGKASIEDDP